MPKTSRGIEINHSDVPIRLFKSDFLEFFTHISPVAVLVIWAPVVAYFLIRAIRNVLGGGAWWIIPVGFIAGVAIWTFAEYTLHRFLFHYHAKGERAQRIFFLFHGVHHAQPQLKTRLVMPPVVSIPLAAIFYGLFYLVVAVLLKGPQWVEPLFAGFMVGYLAYDLIHYATHHFKMRSGYWKYIKRYHMAHHFKAPNALYGVSSPIWDYVFKTTA